jgi:hypothetical protein
MQHLDSALLFDAERVSASQGSKHARVNVTHGKHLLPALRTSIASFMGNLGAQVSEQYATVGCTLLDGEQCCASSYRNIAVGSTMHPATPRRIRRCMQVQHQGDSKKHRPPTWFFAFQISEAVRLPTIMHTVHPSQLTSSDIQDN